MPKLVLASSSSYRKELLKRLQRPFLSRSPDIDETRQQGESPENLVKRLSEGKARALSQDFPNHLIIGSDQVAVLDTTHEHKAAFVPDQAILTKPGCYKTAFEQLKSQSGKRVSFLTGLALLNSKTNHAEVDIVTTEVVFRQLTDREITDYLHQDTPYDCAGSFKSEGLGITLFDSVHSSDPTALIGLPLIRLGQMLRKQTLQITL
ncbi:MAG: septum formation inhibitor Maf [Porticoccaceae bacterium]|nr:MAG: septum formation inhibitor Maf [Porticoccaceae bacterium]